MGPVNTMGQDSLARAVGEAGIEVPPFWFDEVGSTNDEARRLAIDGAPAWTVVAAGHQTSGRGRLGRSWLDVPGRSMLCSVILRPRLAPDKVHLISLAAAVAMIEAVGLPALSAKWPNDLVIDDRKCGGILAEAEIRGEAVRHVVLGVGLNISGRVDEIQPELREMATSLALEGAEVDREGLLAGFLAVLRRLVTTSVFPRGITDAYRPRCGTLGRMVRAVTTAGDRIEGLAVDVDERGSLVVERAGRLERVASGEVEHLGPG